MTCSESCKSCYLGSPCLSFRLGTPIYWTHVFFFLSGVPLYFLHYFAHLNYENFLTPNEEFGHIWDSELKKKKTPSLAIWNCCSLFLYLQALMLGNAKLFWVLLLCMKPGFLSGSLQDLLSASVFERPHFSDLMAPCPSSKLGALHARPYRASGCSVLQ